jgi:phosphomannomutase
MTLISSISGIRGTIGGSIGNSFTPLDIVRFTSAYSNFIKGKSENKKIVIGRDARMSGEMVTHLVVGSLIGCGLDVIDIGLTTTPTVEVAVPLCSAAGGIIITASHNPKEWNALKLLNDKGEFLSKRDGEDILKMSNNKITYNKIDELGSYLFDDSYNERHLDMILDLPLVNKELVSSANFNVVIDAVNSTGGFMVPRLLDKLGVEYIKLFCEPNGDFPHNPEPLKENLFDISDLVVKENADFGIVVDPDVDRLAIVCEDGTMFGEEYTLVTIADYILSNQPGNTVSNLSSTRALQDITSKYNMNYYASAVGEVNVVDKMKESSAIIGGEGNGGVIYPELHYGRDALLGIALFLTQLASKKISVSNLRDTYPRYFISKNKIELKEGFNIDHIFSSIAKKYKGHKITTIDGLKIDFDNEWVHLRKSNTEPIIRIYAESVTEDDANSLAEGMICEIKKYCN